MNPRPSAATARRARFGLLADFDTVFDTAFGFLCHIRGLWGGAL
jgi:hypothetical protein